MSYLFKKEKGSVGLHRYKGKSFMWNLVQFMINFNVITNTGKFKIGDRVRYNWRSKIQIKSATKLRETFTVSDVYCNGDNVRFKEGGGCNVFWIRKAYWWEK